MAINDINSYHYKKENQSVFTISQVNFEKACVVNTKTNIKEYTVFWIQKGKGNYHIDFESHDFGDHTLLFLTPGQHFSIENEKINKAIKISFVSDFYCLETHDKEVACNGVLFNNIYKTPHLNIATKPNDKLHFIVEAMIEEFEYDDKAKYDMLLSLLKQFMVVCARAHTQSETANVDKQESKLFKDFSLLVEKNYLNYHNVGYYAEKLALSPKSLAKHFQKMNYQTPNTYIKDRILLEAKRKLKFENSSVKEIGWDLGFDDPSYFSRFFTQKEGVSPLEFKKKQQ